MSRCSCSAGVSPALLILPCALLLCCLLFAGTGARSRPRRMPHRPQQNSRPQRPLLRSASTQLRLRKNPPLSRALFSSRPRRKRTAPPQFRRLGPHSGSLGPKTHRRISDRDARRRSQLSTSIHATAACATRIFSSRNSCPSSKATIASAPTARTAASPASRWEAMARCGSRFDIRKCSARSARTAPR